jgi:prepilin-type N-terminal cleavage/methylation domain-containing protein
MKKNSRACPPRRINRQAGFTLIEIIVAIGVLGVLMAVTVGILTMSFKTKNLTDANELLSAKSIFILQELKNNILNAEKGTIICPTQNGEVGTSIGFDTKNGGYTTLLCDDVGAQISSSSADGTFGYLDGTVRAINCNNFVRCNLSSGSEVVSIGFSLNLETGASGTIGTTGLYYETVTPRN